MRRNNDGHSGNDKPALRALEFREAFLEQITAEDVAEIGAALLKRAKEGDLAATRIIFDRLLGSDPVKAWESRSQVELLASLDF
jgi:hypothetical protein